MPNLLTKEQIESIYETATDILATVGVEFDLKSARDLFKKHDATVEGKRVFISPGLLAEALKLMPGYTHETTDTKKLIAVSAFSNCPMVLDDRTGVSRRGSI